MLRLLRWLFTGDGHLHQWEDVEVIRLVNGNMTTGYTHHCKCIHCGEHRSFTNWN